MGQFNTAAKFDLVWGPKKAGKKSKAGPPDNFSVANGPTAFGFRPENPEFGCSLPSLIIYPLAVIKENCTLLVAIHLAIALCQQAHSLRQRRCTARRSGCRSECSVKSTPVRCRRLWALQMRCRRKGTRCGSGDVPPDARAAEAGARSRTPRHADHGQ